MNRADWLPEATYFGVSTHESFGAVVTTSCFGVIDRVSDVHTLSKSPKGRGILDRVWTTYPTGSDWRLLRFPQLHRVWWKEACLFKTGHPGSCGTELPDIFDERGNVRPAIQRRLEQIERRNNRV